MSGWLTGLGPESWNTTRVNFVREGDEWQVVDFSWALVGKDPEDGLTQRSVLDGDGWQQLP